MSFFDYGPPLEQGFAGVRYPCGGGYAPDTAASEPDLDPAPEPEVEAPPEREVRVAPLILTDPTRLEDVPVPERQWMIEGWMPWRNTTALYGDGGVGKTLLAQMLGTSAATGRAWLGLEVRRCRTLGVLCEDDDDELHRRQADINAAMGLNFRDLRDLRWISRVGQDNLLMTFESDGVGVLAPFWDQIVSAARGFGAQLIILDTAADMFGGNENARPQVRQFIQGACTRLAMEIDGAVLLCAHPSVAGMNSGEGSSGSTGWNNSVRSRWYLTRPKAEADEPVDDSARVLTKKKANYSTIGDEIEMEWRVGAFHVRHARSMNAVDRIADSARERQAEGAFLAALAARNVELRSVSHSKQAENFAPKVLVGRQECKGFTKKDLTDAMERLFQAGRIKSAQEIGRDKQRHRVFSIAEVSADVAAAPMDMVK